MLTITMKNSGGILDTAQASNAESAVEAMIFMLNTAGELHPGDTFTVEGSEEDTE